MKYKIRIEDEITARSPKQALKIFQTNLNDYDDACYEIDPRHAPTTAEVCELAHLLTVKECKEKNIAVDKQFNKNETGYTAKAEKIFSRYFVLITETLNI